MAGNIIGGGIATVMGDIAVGDVTCLEDAMPSFLSGAISSSISEGLCHASNAINKRVFKKASRATQKSILTNKVFKEGNLYYNWTWKGYGRDTRFLNYLDRGRNAIENCWDIVSSGIGAYWGRRFYE